MLPSPSWLTLVTESSVVLGIVDIIALVEVDVWTKVVGEPIEPNWLMKVE